MNRASFYRKAKRGAPPTEPVCETAAPCQKARHPSPRALSQEERAEALATLLSERFVEQAPPQIVATLLDEGVYLCSAASMYRLLRAEEMVQERRHQRRHRVYSKPELLARGPNEIWSWDITKVRHEAIRIIVTCTIVV